LSPLTVNNFPNLPQCLSCTYKLKRGEEMRKCPICETVYHAVVGAQATCPKGHGYWQQMEKIGLAKIKGGD